MVFYRMYTKNRKVKKTTKLLLQAVLYRQIMSLVNAIQFDLFSKNSFYIVKIYTFIITWMLNKIFKRHFQLAKIMIPQHQFLLLQKISHLASNWHIQRDLTAAFSISGGLFEMEKI